MLVVASEEGVCSFDCMEVLADLPEVAEAFRCLCDSWGVEPKRIIEDFVYTAVIHAPKRVLLISRAEVVLPVQETERPADCLPQSSQRGTVL